MSTYDILRISLKCIFESNCYSQTKGVFDRYLFMSCVQPLYVLIMLTTTLQVQANDADTCEVCPANSFCSGGNMNECPFASASQAGSTLRTECYCIPGYFGTTGFSAGTCNQCPPNSYCGGGEEKGSSSTGCPEFAESSEGSTSQSDCVCSAGYYEESEGNCDLCPIGSYCTGDGDEQDCPLYTITQTTGATQLTDCQCLKGTSGNANGVECTPC